MRDEGALVDPNAALSPSERAVLYMLRRIRLDANLRWYMLSTEAFALLCEAEATRTGKTGDDVMDYYSTPAEHCKDDEADVCRLRRELDAAPKDDRRKPNDEVLRTYYSEVPAWLTETSP